MPGLVNVHTHLDYTVMRGLIEDIAFFPWIRELTMRKACSSAVIFVDKPATTRADPRELAVWTIAENTSRAGTTMSEICLP